MTCAVALTAVVLARDACLLSAGFYVRYISLPPPVFDFCLVFVLIQFLYFCSIILSQLFKPEGIDGKVCGLAEVCQVFVGENVYHKRGQHRHQIRVLDK